MPSAGGPEFRRLPLETTAPGIFAAGDVRHDSVKRVAAAVGEGAAAVQQVLRYLRTSRPDRASARVPREATWTQRSHVDRVDQRVVGPNPVSLPSSSRYVIFPTPFS